MKPKPVDLSNETSLGYIVGCVAGDGCFGIYGRGNYVVDMKVKDEDFAKAFYEHLRMIRLNPNFLFYNKFYNVKAHSKQLYLYLKSLEKNTIIGNTEIFKRFFLRGLFDSDGWVSSLNLDKPNKATRNIGLANNNKELIDITKSILSQFGIKFTIKSRIHSGFGSRKTQYELHIHGRKNLVVFSEKIGFYIKRKQESLERALNSFRGEIRCQNCRAVVILRPHQPAIKYCKDCSMQKAKEYKKRYRQTQKFKEFNKIYSQRWRDKNREKYNEHMKLYHRKYRKLKKDEKSTYITY